jgi:uncharacterized membrane protein (DUF485 family)
MLRRVEHAHNGDRAAHDQPALVRTIMRRQAALGLRVAAVFVLILIGLPLLNLYLPDLMATHVGGFTLTWLLLAVLFYPVTWLLSWWFVRGSDGIEHAIANDYRNGSLGPATPAPLSEPITSNPEPTTKKKLFVEEDEA